MTAIFRLIAISLALLPTLPAVAGAGTPDRYEVVFHEHLVDGWNDWSWGHVEIGADDRSWGGRHSIAMHLGPWEGLLLQRDDAIELGAGAVSFAIHAEQPVTLWLTTIDRNGHESPRQTIHLDPWNWTVVEASAADLGWPNDISEIQLQHASSGHSGRLHLDNLGIDVAPTQAGRDEPLPQPYAPTPTTTPPTTAAPTPTTTPTPTPPISGATTRIDLDGGRIERVSTDPYTREQSVHVVDFPHAIDDRVYGLNFASEALVEELGTGVHRWGGNSAERFNPQNDASIIGADWYFMSFVDEFDAEHRFEERNEAAGVETHFQIPIMGWITRDADTTCGFDIAAAGLQDEQFAHFDDPSLVCGNGFSNGEQLPPAPERTSMQVGPSFVTDWVRELVDRHGSAADGGVEAYALGNEPNLWADTHRDIWAAPPERDEIIERNITHAAAVKDGDPTAATYGPALWGGSSYFGTSAEFDREEFAGSNETFVAEYLREMRLASEAEGRRLLDGLDIHFYDGRTYPTGPADQRLEATRSLWDNGYVPVDWWAVEIADWPSEERWEGMALIPRMKSLIDLHFPGTELSISEYNFGSLDTIDGAIAQADALGIFGREGVDRAMLWDPLDPPSTPEEAEYLARPGMFAFRMFLNADGAGERFGDEALFVETSDEAAVSVFAARRSDGAITVMLINKTDTTRTELVDLDGLDGSARGFRYDESDLDSIQQFDPILDGGALDIDVPPMSISMVVIDAA